MVTFMLFARPAIRAMLARRRRAAAGRRRSSTSEHAKAPGRAHWSAAGSSSPTTAGTRGRPRTQGSHVLTSMLGADALAILPTESGPVSAGERVEIELLP